MARQLTPLGRILIVLSGMALVGYGLYRYGVFARIASILAPDRKAEGEVSKDDFGAVGPSTSASATTASTVKGGSRLTRPIKVAIVTWGGYAGGIFANGGNAPNKESLFYKDQGIEVELLVIDDFEKSRDAFRAGGDKGGVDIMWSTVDAFALEYSGLKKLNPKAILQYDWSRGGDAIAVDGSIKSVADLRGKKLACAEATPSHYFALYALTQGGLTNRDVQWVFTTSAVDAANVFKAGKVDAAVSWSPDVYIAARERPGAHILASTKEASNLIADIFVARGDFIEQHPEDIRRFVAGWLKGVDLANANPEKTALLLTKSFSGIGLEDAKGMLQDVKLPTYAENRAFFAAQGMVANYNSIYKTAQGIWRRIGKVSEVFEPLPDRGHAIPRWRQRVLRRRGRGQARVRVQGAAQAGGRAHPDEDRLRLFPERLLDPGRERQGGAGDAGRGARRDLRQCLHADRREHRQRRLPGPERAPLPRTRRRGHGVPGLEGLRAE